MGAMKTISTTRAAVISEVKAELARRGITPTELGRITGRGQQYWSRRTTGHTPFDVDDFGTLSAILRIPMSRLMPEYIPEESPLSESNRRPPLYRTVTLDDLARARNHRTRPANRRDPHGPSGRAA